LQLALASPYKSALNEIFRVEAIACESHGKARQHTTPGAKHITQHIVISDDPITVGISHTWVWHGGVRIRPFHDEAFGACHQGLLSTAAFLSLHASSVTIASKKKP
jgi:hypothetical protein